MNRLTLSGLAALALSVLAAESAAQLDDCQPEWLPTFGGRPFAGNVYALAVGDDGSGGQPELYAGGTFSSSVTAIGNCISKWNGWNWSPLGTGILIQTGSEKVEAIVVSDAIEGTPIVYAGGKFTMAGGQSAANIAQWDGSSWAPLGSGLTGTNAEVRALAIFDDGGGPALYAAGIFSTAGGLPAGRIAKWNGSSWSALASGTNGEIKALAVFDDGSGPALYAAGTLSTAGGQPANRIARWNGLTWSAVGTGVNGTIYALTTFDDGSGEKLYAAGSLSGAEVVRWDGTTWTAVGTGLDNIVMALTAHDNASGAGPQLWAAGDLFIGGGLRHIARLDGSTWTTPGDGLDSFAYALTSYDDGGPEGPSLLVGGIFDEADDVFVNGLGRWTGDEWTTVGDGFNGTVTSSAIFVDGGGPTLFVGGSFKDEPGGFTGGVARWDGSAVTIPGGGVSGSVNELIVFDDGNGGGSALYAGGPFTSAGGVPASRAARWDGSSWSPLGSGLNDEVRAWALFDDGSGGGPRSTPAETSRSPAVPPRTTSPAGMARAGRRWARA